MTVNDILLHKGRQVITIEPTATVAAAVRMLAQRRVGALVVTGAEYRIVGIISERDVVRVLDEIGPAVLDAPVAEVMTVSDGGVTPPSVVFVDPGTSTPKAPVVAATCIMSSIA